MYSIATMLLLGQSRPPEVGYNWTVQANLSASSYESPQDLSEVLAEVSILPDGQVRETWDQAVSSSFGFSTVRRFRDAFWWGEVDPNIGSAKEVRISLDSGDTQLALRNGYPLGEWLSMNLTRTVYMSVGAGYGNLSASAKIEFRDSSFPTVIELTKYVTLSATRVF